MSDERINPITAPNYNVTPFLDYYGTKTRVEFSGKCLKQDKVTYTHGRVVNIYIIYENISDYPTLENCWKLYLIGMKVFYFLTLD